MPFKKSAIFELSPALAANQSPGAEPARAPRLPKYTAGIILLLMCCISPKQAQTALGEGMHNKARSGHDFFGED